VSTSALPVLCALGGKYCAKSVSFCFCFEMKGLGIGRVVIGLDGHRAIPSPSHPRDVDLSPGDPGEERDPSTSSGILRLLDVGIVVWLS